jgi:hypothetical protein
MLLASMLIAQVVISASAPPLSPAEAARVLRASRSTADLTDLPLAEAPEPPLLPVHANWRPGDGPFGSFDQRLTRLDFLRRGSVGWIPAGYDARARFHTPGVQGWPLTYRDPFVGMVRAPGRGGRAKR